MKQWVWLVVAMTALAGCTSEEEDTGPKCLENQFEDAMGNCIDHVEPAIVLTGLPEQLTRYFSVDFTWALDNGTRGTDEVVHSMDSRILASMNATVTDNTTAPDDWGTQIARQEHKDLPDEFTASLRWDEVGTLYLKGYMLIDAKHVWIDLGSIQITDVVASGNRTTVTISSGAPSLSERETTVTVGDGVTFDNQHEFIAYTLTFEGDDCPNGGSIAAGSTLDVDFVVPGSCPYTLTTAASPTIEQGDLSGKVTVGTP